MTWISIDTWWKQSNNLSSHTLSLVVWQIVVQEHINYHGWFKSVHSKNIAFVNNFNDDVIMFTWIWSFVWCNRYKVYVITFYLHLFVCQSKRKRCNDGDERTHFDAMDKSYRSVVSTLISCIVRKTALSYHC